MINTIWKFLDPPRSKKYNEDTIVKVLKSYIGQVHSPPAPFKRNVQEHFVETSHKFMKRLEAWVDVEAEINLEIEMINEMGNNAEFPPPNFPLLPVPDATRSQVIQ